MRKLALIVGLAACRPAPVAPVSSAMSPAASSSREPDQATTGPRTSVVTLGDGVPTPILDGPALVNAINPGTDLYLALAPSHRCDDAGVVWFGYSGGGVGVGPGQTLCARSIRHEPHTQAFSAHD